MASRIRSNIRRLLSFNFCRSLKAMNKLEPTGSSFSQLFFSPFQIERELILSTDKSGSKVPLKQYSRQIPTTPVAFNRSSISNGNGATSGVIQQFLPKSSTAVAPDHPALKHAWVSNEIEPISNPCDWIWNKLNKSNRMPPLGFKISPQTTTKERPFGGRRFNHEVETKVLKQQIIWETKESLNENANFPIFGSQAIKRSIDYRQFAYWRAQKANLICFQREMRQLWGRL